MNTLSKKQIILFLTFITILFIFLLFIRIFYVDEEIERKHYVLHSDNAVSSSLIESNEEDSYIHVEYPIMNKKNIDNIITNYVYSYVKEFKNIDAKKSLEIKYDLYYKDEFVNVVFYINDSTSKIKYKNLLFNIKNNDVGYITNMYDSEELSSTIYDIVKYKYSNYIYETIKKDTINNFTYVIDDNEMDIYFYNLKFIDISYQPYIKINLKDNTPIIDKVEKSKYIIFTFDDGPSEYTEEILKTLEYNDSSATFFMLGNKMNGKKEVVKMVDNSNSEVASHTYSHKNLTTLSIGEVKNEISKTNTIFKNITGHSIKYVRPPYGAFNKELFTTDNYFITWNIDPRDWYYKNSKKVYNHILDNACNGCIALMHDVHYTTIDAVRMLIPELQEKGYKVISVSKAVKISNKTLSKSKVTTKIK